MHAVARANVKTAGLAVFFWSGLAFGDGLTISIDNNTTNDLRVTVYDLSSHPAQLVLSGEKINSFASVSITINTDESGVGRLSWTATTLDRDSRTCGHRVKTKLNDRDTVHVYANSECTPK
jgi:hypothetical protein